MCNTCEIKWAVVDGRFTGDENLAIGRVRTMARVEQIAGRGVSFDQSRWYNICAEHAKRLADPGMHIWEFEPFACASTHCERRRECAAPHECAGNYPKPTIPKAA